MYVAFYEAAATGNCTTSSKRKCQHKLHKMVTCRKFYKLKITLNCKWSRTCPASELKWDCWVSINIFPSFYLLLTFSSGQRPWSSDIVGGLINLTEIALAICLEIILFISCVITFVWWSFAFFQHLQCTVHELWAWNMKREAKNLHAPIFVMCEPARVSRQLWFRSLNG